MTAEDTGALPLLHTRCHNTQLVTGHYPIRLAAGIKQHNEGKWKYGCRTGGLTARQASHRVQVPSEGVTLESESQQRWDGQEGNH